MTHCNDAGTIGLTEPAAVEEFGQDNIKVKQARFPSMYVTVSEEGGLRTGTCGLCFSPSIY